LEKLNNPYKNKARIHALAKAGVFLLAGGDS